jgi:hypothetical protein
VDGRDKPGHDAQFNFGSQLDVMRIVPETGKMQLAGRLAAVS